MLLIPLVFGGSAQALASGGDTAPHPGVPDDILARIRASEYHFGHLGDDGSSAPNRAQDLRVRVDERGVGFEPRTRTRAWFHVSLCLESIGRAGHAMLPGQGILTVDGPRASTWRPASRVRERVVNTPGGVEHTFLLERRPPGPRNHPLELRVSITGDVRGHEIGQHSGVVLRREDGSTALRYDRLIALDSRNRSLPARMRIDGTTLILQVDDAAARYPLTLDPLATSASWTAETDQPDAPLEACSTAGDLNGDGISDVVLGAPGYDQGQPDEGKVFVYLGLPGSTLEIFPSWSAAGGQAGAAFGKSVSAAGDVNGDGYDDLVVGAPSYDTSLHQDAGKVVVFLGSQQVLGASPAWSLVGQQTGEFVGGAVATAGDVNGDDYADIIIGATGTDTAQAIDVGSARVFHGGPGGLGAQAATTVYGEQAQDHAGYRVGGLGDWNGDGFDDVYVHSENSMACSQSDLSVFAGSADGVQQPRLWRAPLLLQLVTGFYATMGRAGDVNGDGYDDALVKVAGFSCVPAQPCCGQLPGDWGGRVYLYYGSASGQAEASWWTWGDNGELLEVEAGATTAGDVNGDGFADFVVFHTSRTVDLYFGSPTGPVLQPNLLTGTRGGAAGDVNGDGFGDVLTLDDGVASVYLGSADGLSQTAARTIIGGQAGARLGISVASAGDVNGDGFSDVVFGASDYDAGEVDEGRAYLYLGSAAGLTSAPGWIAESNQAGARLGAVVGSFGDVNGDGYGDLFVGAPSFADGEGGEGAVFCWHGHPSFDLDPDGTPQNADWSGFGDQVDAEFGASAGTAGDVNGDGYSDALVGAPGFDAGSSNEGRALLYLGSPTGLATTPAWTCESNQKDASLGAAVSTAGDVNRDGFSDLLIGAPLYDDPSLDEGAAFIWLGSGSFGSQPDGTPANADWVAEGNQAGAQFGASVAAAGDLNGGGYSDVIVGAPMLDAGEADEGIAAVYLGGISGPSTTAAWFAQGDFAGAMLGTSVTGAGDVDLDGFSDILIGAPGWKGGSDESGGAFLWRGSIDFNSTPDGTPANADWAVAGASAGDHLGQSVASAGDVNGDGFCDVLLGAPDLQAMAGAQAGSAYLYLGNGIDAPDRAPVQWHVNSDVPIGLLGRSDDETSIRLHARGRTASGRARVRLEWDVALLSSAFFSNIGTGAWHRTGAPAGGSSVLLTETVTGLDPGHNYHWRARTHSSSPYFPYSPWFSPVGNGRGELDFRTSSQAGDVDHPGTFPRTLEVFPNPAAGTVRFSFRSNGGRARVTVRDVTGRTLRVLLDSSAASDDRWGVWDGVDEQGHAVAAGVYLIDVLTGDRRETRRFVLLR